MNVAGTCLIVFLCLKKQNILFKRNIQARKMQQLIFKFLQPPKTEPGESRKPKTGPTTGIKIMTVIQKYIPSKIKS